MFNQSSTSISPENIRKLPGFFKFSRGIEVEHWLRMGDQKLPRINSVSWWKC